MILKGFLLYNHNYTPNYRTHVWKHTMSCNTFADTKACCWRIREIIPKCYNERLVFLPDLNKGLIWDTAIRKTLYLASPYTLHNTVDSSEPVKVDQSFKTCMCFLPYFNSHNFLPMIWILQLNGKHLNWNKVAQTYIYIYNELNSLLRKWNR